MNELHILHLALSVGLSCIMGFLIIKDKLRSPIKEK